MIGALVLRPEPGNTETATALERLGIDVIRQPLFEVRPVAWRPPRPGQVDALLLTSANAVRHAGEDLRALAALPVLAVGAATAAAARGAGLCVVLIGDSDAVALVARARAHGYDRPLHLAGRDRVAPSGVEAIAVYESAVLPIAPGAASTWENRIALVHSARAARRLAALIRRDGADRTRIGLAALSAAVATAAGPGWAAAAVAARPTDAALIDRVAAAMDKRRR